jgi:glutamine synthetase
LLDGKPNKPHLNLRDAISYLNFDVFQENTDRNRTSPYAYTGNRFEFRALGSSQNPSYALAVITAVLAQEIQIASERVDKGESIESIIKELVEETRAIRFEGNGYSEEWKVEAKRRGLYVNEDFTEIYSFMEQAQAIFEDLNICSSQETHSRAVVAQNHYKETVSIELKTLLLLADRHILPEGYIHLQRMRGDFHSDVLDREFSSFKQLFEGSVKAVQELREAALAIEEDLVKFQSLRGKVDAAGDLLSELSVRLPGKEGGLPELHELLRL